MWAWRPPLGIQGLFGGLFRGLFGGLLGAFIAISCKGGASGEDGTDEGSGDRTDSASGLESDDEGDNMKSTEPPVLGSVVTVLRVVGDSAVDSGGQTPVTIGHVFAPGAVSSEQTLQARNLASQALIPLQVDKKATHRDGSLRHAVLTLAVEPPPEGEFHEVELVVSAVQAEEPVSLEDVFASSYDLQVDIEENGTRYTASARQALETNATPWLEGPLVGEWYSTGSLVDPSGRPHPHLHVRFSVRATAGATATRTSLTVENTWAYVDAPRNHVYDLIVTGSDGGRQEWSAVPHSRQARWRRTWWQGSPPAVRALHHRGDLLASGAFPHFDPSLMVSAEAIANNLARLHEMDTGPMSTGIVEPYMPATGGRPDIGPLPQWSVHHLLSTNANAEAVSMRQDELFGSWPVHYRDQDTDLPVMLDNYPYMTLLGSPSDAVDPAGNSHAFPECGGDCQSSLTPDSAHQPSIGYMSYALSGDIFFLEELQFWANYNLFRSNPHYRGFDEGLLRSGQVRGQAWSLRTLGQAAFITPDEHPLKRYFEGKLENNLRWYASFFSDNPNPLGLFTEGGAFAYDEGRGIAPWQDDFFTWSLGYLAALGYEEAKPLVHFKAAFPISRMIDSGYCWILGASYSLMMRENDSAPIYGDWARVYSANFEPEITRLECGGEAMGAALGLEAGEMTGYSTSASGYPSNMQPALAIAVDEGVPGAEAAWERFMQRSVKPDYSVEPSFAIVPIVPGER